MRVLVLFVLLSGCRNDAISYAKMLDDGAECQSKNLYTAGNDTAVCKFQGKIWWCDGGGKTSRPSCSPFDSTRAEK